MIKFKNFVNDTNLTYVVENNISLGELYRVGSESYYKIFRDARKQYAEGNIELSGRDLFMIEQTDIGEFAFHNHQHVPLDSPMLEEKEQDMPLNKPKRGGPKKYYVYVKDPKTDKIKKISWGDTTGLKAKIDDPAARKSFAARHQCDTKTDKMTAGYWACRLPYYADQLGLSGGGNFFW